MSSAWQAAWAAKEGVFHNPEPRRGGPSSGGSSAARWSPRLALIGFVGLCLLVGAAGGAVTSGNLPWYFSLRWPPGTPPAWLFGPVWTLLYVLLGVSGWLVWRETGRARPVRLWGWQLLLNAFWAPAFFGLHSPALGLVVMLPLAVAIAALIPLFHRFRRLAAWLLVPYLGWVCYAAWLNAGFWWLNR